MRYTVKDLRNKINALNYQSFCLGNTSFIREQGRNGYQAADLYFVEADGRERCSKMVGGGTAKEVALYCDAETAPRYFDAKKMSRAQVKTLLKVNGVDFSKDFHELDSNAVHLLNMGAKFSNYRRPANANGSLARYFFANLVKRVK